VLEAQDAAGYLGKKTMIGGAIHYSPAFGILVEETNSGTTVGDLLLPSPRLGLSLKQVLSEKGVLNIDFTYQNILVQRNYEVTNTYTSAPYVSTTIYPNIRTSAMTFSVGYAKHVYHVAPVGAYIGGNFCLILLNTQAFDGGNNSTKVFGQDLDAGGNIEYGLRRVIKDRIVFDVGITLALYARGLVSLVAQNAIKDPTDKIMNMAIARNYFDNLCTLKAGIYYLVF
jgi:hypothetical protein